MPLTLSIASHNQQLGVRHQGETLSLTPADALPDRARF